MSSAINYGLLVILLITVLDVTLIIGQNEIIEHDYSRDLSSVYPSQQIDNIASGGNGGSTWFSTVRNAIAQPAGQMVMHMAKEMISRSAGNSQILSLNLTNLLVLILLKALIFAAGLLGAGNFGQYARGRSAYNPFFNEDETPLFIGFLASEGSGQDGCLNRAACQSPQTAEEYLKAARALMKSAEIFDTDYLNMNTTSYSKLIYQVEQSIKEGKDGAPCDTIYSCRI